jgi:hypothetical protein
MAIPNNENRVHPKWNLLKNIFNRYFGLVLKEKYKQERRRENKPKLTRTPANEKV